MVAAWELRVNSLSLKDVLIHIFIKTYKHTALKNKNKTSRKMSNLRKEELIDMKIIAQGHRRVDNAKN